MKEQIKQRLAELAAERDTIQREAERRLSAYAGAIEELQRLLKQIEEQDHAAAS